jgi:DNA-binding beta-propeller fold protein YncE
MRSIIGFSFCLALAPLGLAQRAAKPERPSGSVIRHDVSLGPKGGIKTPGVQIPFTNLKAEFAFETPKPPGWIGFTDAIFVPNQAGDGLDRIDPRAKEAKLGDALTDLKQPCGGIVNAFTSLWVVNCGDGTLARVDAKTNKPTASIAAGVGRSRRLIAATSDSIWLLSDTHATLSRIDPQEKTVVAELRVPADCGSLIYGESALWLACPGENRVLRIDPATNLVDKSIEVSAQPEALAIGETSVWVLCAKDGKLERIDPKTNKVVKTIELGAPAGGGSVTIGDGFAWVAMPGFPITRVDPGTDKVVQQFYGDAFGVLQSAGGFLWLADTKSGKLLKIDPKRVIATLAE